MSKEITKFNKDNVIDTCSIWNLFYSRKFYSISTSYLNSFVITDYVKYESLGKKWSHNIDKETELKGFLGKEILKKRFNIYNISIEELQDPLITKKRKNLGKGELSCIAFAKSKSISIITDDQGARKHAKDILGYDRVRTIPHLLGFLVFNEFILDADISVILSDHKNYSSDIIEHLNKCCESAFLLKLNKAGGIK